MGDQSKNGSDPNQGLQMPDYATANMVASSQSPMTMSMAQSCIAGLPALAPAPPTSHQQQQLAPAPHNSHLQQHTIQTSQIQQIHPGSAPPQQSMAGQPMTQQQQQQLMGQPQFLIQQHFPGQHQYATFPQFAYANQQGQLVLQPAQFSLPGGPSQQGQQVILAGVPQKPGAQPQMISSSQGKPGQPAYTITNSGQLQMAGPHPQQQTFMIANPMGSGVPSVVSMAGPNGQTQAIHTTSMAGMKGSDGKPIPGPPQLTGPTNPQQQQFVIPSPGGGMAYMQAGPHQILQNGQLIFRGPGPGDQQQVMFSPSGQQHPPPQQQVQHTNNLQNPNNPLGGMQIPGPRPPLPVVGPPPGKTAISRAIAPLPPSVSQTNARIGYVANQQGQPSPKSKQKMSPRGNHNGVGRPPVPKGNNMKMMPRMAGVIGGPPGSPQMMPGSPRPPMIPVQQHNIPMTSVGPPTLSPMGPEPVNMNMPNISLPPTTFVTTQVSQIQTSIQPQTVPLQTRPTDRSLDPPTLTKEVITPMPNLGQPNLNHKAFGNMSSKPGNFSSPDGEQGLVPTPKAVVKPQVLTHVIDGHVIKESSQPFPVSPVKATARRKSEKVEDKPLSAGPGGQVKRGPGRPPGSTKSNEAIKSNGLEPPEKKLKTKEAVQQIVPPPPVSGATPSSGM